MKTAIIGCGLAANLHAHAILGNGHELSIVVDHNPSRAESFARQYGAGNGSDQFEAALSAEIDCVHICTPPAFHYPMIKAALLAGKHVICEKPLVLENQQAQELLQLAKHKKLVHAVNFTVRFYDACQEASRLIRSDNFGRAMIIHGSYQQEYHIPPAENSWRYQPDFAGPMRAATEIGSHWLDLARYLTGLEITGVSATFANFSPNRVLDQGKLGIANSDQEISFVIHSEDAAIITLHFSNGAIGNVVLSEVSHGRQNAVFIEVVGEKQSVWWDGETPNQLYQAQRNKGTEIKRFSFAGAYPETFSSFIKNVYRHIEDPVQNAVTYPTFHDGMVNTMICNGIFESAQNNGKWVSIPDISGSDDE